MAFYSNKIKETLFYLKINCFRRPALRLFESLVDEGKLLRSEREKLATERISAILQHAYENTEFYRKHYDSNQFDVYSFESLDDMLRIPIVSKEDLATYSSEFFASNCPKKHFRKSVTGGSSGVPTTVYHDARVQLEGFGWYLMKLWGGKPSSNAAFLERYNPSAQGKLTYLLNQLIWWPTRRAHLDITNVTEKRLWEFYEHCSKIKPMYIEGYVGAIQEFAQFVSMNQLQLPSVSFVWTTSAPLTKSTRKIISQAFRCPVYDQYGCCEVYWLGAEICSDKKLHVFDTFRHIETINNSGQHCDVDEYGSVLLTDMLNYSFPLIRYQNGDRAAYAPDCSCGVTQFGVIRPVKGRVTENILLPGGGFIAGEFLTTIFDDFPNAVSQFQVIQNEDYSVSVSFIPCIGTKAEQELVGASDHIRHIFANAGIKFELNATTVISHDDGKLRYVISKLKSLKLEN